MKRRLRELEFHPERHVDRAALSPADAQRVDELISRKRRWVETPQTPINARERCRAIRAANESLQSWLEDQRQHCLALRDEATHRTRADAVLRWREYAFCLYPEETLREFYGAMSGGP